MSKSYLILADGSVFEGEAFGAPVEGVGELVFSTSVVGYIETLTDPAYYGQIVMQTFPSLGNYGVIEEDFDGPCAARGYVVREWCDTPSNFRSQYTLDQYLKKAGVPGICGVDTRALTQRIRDCGVMNAMIAGHVPEDLSALKSFAIKGGVAALGAKAQAVHPAQGEKKHTVALIDCGARPSFIQQLTSRGLEVVAVPPTATAEQILALGADGVVLSEGPGDPAENTQLIAEVKALMGRLPMFGQGLGHQLIALAAGGRTEKLRYGHRGGNQPVIDTATQHTYITSQNHGYAVLAETVPGAVARWVNANDQTCEGLDYPALNAFSVQFTPASCPGPRDTCAVYDRFVDAL